ncbi:MAG: ATP-binding cassette domain-containing protein [Cyclobacteriaceae bacterium]
MKQDTVIEFSDVSKSYKVGSSDSLAIRDIFTKGQNPLAEFRTIQALKNVSFKVRRNEKFGIIGRNGSGKSTIINLIMGAMRPDQGSIRTEGKIMKLESGTGFDNELNAFQNVMLSGSLLGLPKKDIIKRYEEIISFAELEEFQDLKIKNLSKGMKSRLAFATAMHVNPDIMLLDEFFGGGGDIKFKKKSDELFKERVLTDKSLVIVSHSLSTIREYCDRAMWLETGIIKDSGDPNWVCDEYEAYHA